MEENNTIKKNISSTPYDDVFRTMLNDCTRFVLPLLNEIFGENYDGTEKIVFANDYHFKNMQDGVEDKIITDSSFKVIKDVKEKKYHLECQSTIDNSMVLRFFEYDSQIALDDAEVVRNKLILTFPHSAVLFLRSNKKTDDVMQIHFKTPGGEVMYDIPVVKMQKYEMNDIWEKKLYFLIPFYIFVHEANFQSYNSDEKLLSQLMNEFSEICTRLGILADEEEISELEKRTIIELSKKVVDNIAAKYRNITGGVEKIMGGKVIETEAKKIYNRGREDGREKGIEQGIEQGSKSKLMELIGKKLAKGKSVSQIADELEESEENIRRMIEQMSEKL